ncbi:MAG: lipopolysaccharide transport periplasmic protein LptA [Oxalobacter sp.]|nr:lipopolysaccharide transport periplasmic protein LptA [Oxalobacter sp.]
MKKDLLKIAAFCLCAALSFNASAEKADSKKPTHIEADQMNSDDVNQVTIFTGNVVIKKGTILAKAGQAKLVEDPEGYRYITLYAAPGQLASIRQKLDSGPNQWMEGYGKRIEYNDKDEVAQFFTEARGKKLEGSKVMEDIQGEYLSYDSKTEFYSAFNTNEGYSRAGAGRVTAVIQPKTTTNSRKKKK